MIEVGTALLGGSLLAGAASVALVAAPPRHRDAWAAAWSHRLFLASWALLAGAFTLLLASFLLADLRIEYVWEHTRKDYPWYYRLAGLWGGQKGTVVMWAFFIATALLVEKRRVLGPLAAPRLAPAEAPPLRVHRAAHALLLGTTLALVGFLLADHAFAPTDARLLDAGVASAQGRGLQEILITPLMIIHPPLQFVAYALAAMPAALALGALAARAPTREWTGPALKWARVAWLFSTVGLGLGGLWAYYVLSFGGYWAWDPVETSNLLPWLALTAFLHAGKYADRFDEYRLAAPLLAFAAFWLTFFATFATRSGLWASVHAFTDPSNKFDPDAMARLVGIMEIHLPTRFFVSLLAVLALVAAALLVRRYALDLGPRGLAVARAYAVLAAALAGLAAAAPVSFVGGLFEAGRVLGMGHAVAGFGALAAALLGLPALWLYLEQPEDEGPTPSRDWARRLMYAAVVVFGVALAVTFILNFQVVNGMDRSVFDARAPFVALPLAVVLTLMLAHTVIGKRGAVALAGGGVALAVGGVLLFRDQWVVAAAVPVLGAAAVASYLKLAQVNRGATGDLRRGGLLLLASSLLGMTMWSNPPSELPLGGAALSPGVLGGAVLFGFAALGLLGAVAALRGLAPRLAYAGAVASTVAAGYGVGALLALAALGLLARGRGGFRGGPFLPAAAPSLRQTGIYLVHLAVAVGLVGYAASTYAQEKEPYILVPVGETVAFADGGSVTVLPPRGTPTEPVVPLRVEHGGSVTEAELAFVWKGGQLDHYAQELRVHRGLEKDVYAAGFGFRFADGAEVATLEPTPPRDPSSITAVTFELTVLPLMTPVWAGLWMMGLGMTLILAAGVAESRARPRSVPVREADAAPAPAPDARRAR